MKSPKTTAAQGVSANGSPQVVGLGALTPDPRNARRRTERSASLLARSMETFGAARSVVIDEQGVVLAGNGTLEAAAQVGIERVLVVPVDGNTLVAVQRTDLNKRQKAEYAVADNRTSDLSGWDARAIADLLDDDPDLSFNPYFTDEELDALNAEQGLLEEEEEKPQERGEGFLQIKLEFESEDDHQAFCDALQQLSAALPKIGSTEKRLQFLMDEYLKGQN